MTNRQKNNWLIGNWPMSAEKQGHRQLCQQLTQTLIVRMLKTHFFLQQSLILKSQQNRIELVTRPGTYLVSAWICVSLWTVSVLQPVGPCPLVLGAVDGGLPHPVPALEPLGPLAAVQPLAPRLHTKAVTLPILPVALVRTSAGITEQTRIIQQILSRLMKALNWKQLYKNG